MSPRRRLQQMVEVSTSTTAVLTPMVDMVFLLMIFFLFGSIDFGERQIVAALSRSGAVSDPPRTTIWLRLRPGAGNQLEYAIDSAPFSSDARLPLDHIAAASRSADDTMVIVDPEQGVTLQQLVDVMGQVRQAGAADVALHGETDRP